MITFLLTSSCHYNMSLGVKFSIGEGAQEIFLFNQKFKKNKLDNRYMRSKLCIKSSMINSPLRRIKYLTVTLGDQSQYSPHTMG